MLFVMKQLFIKDTHADEIEMNCLNELLFDYDKLGVELTNLFSMSKKNGNENPQRATRNA
jgi:hypothetical protein